MSLSGVGPMCLAESAPIAVGENGDCALGPKALRQELAYGSVRFKDQIEAMSQRRVRPGSPGRPGKNSSAGCA